MIIRNIIEVQNEGTKKLLLEALPNKKPLVEALFKTKTYPKEAKDKFEFICLACNHFSACKAYGDLAVLGCDSFKMD